MNSIDKLKANTIASVVNQLVVIVSGFILPRLILAYYGSETNGLVTSVNQFLNIITFLDLGVGSVVQASLYRPLADGDSEQVNLVLSSAQRFFRGIARILVVYVVILMIAFPLWIAPGRDTFATAFLIFSISLNLLSQFYFGVVNQLLVSADQRDYIHLSLQALTTVLNLVASAVLIVLGLPIHWVKFVSGLLFLLRPIYLSHYVKTHYDVQFDVPVHGEPIQQKWNGVAQHIAYTITNSTDTVVLTLFSTLSNVSVYAVYNLVVSAIRVMVNAVTDGLRSFFGVLLAHDEVDRLRRYFGRIEWLTHLLAVFLYGMTYILITDFVLLYTQGVHDANYRQPLFAAILVLAQLVYSMRAPYILLILSAGHFRQTQAAAVIEAVINVVLSLALVGPLGLTGVAIGTLAALAYRAVYSVRYLARHIIQRPVGFFVRQILVDALMFLCFVALEALLPLPKATFLQWIVAAVIYGIIGLVLLLILNLIFYRQHTQFLVRSLLRFVSGRH